MKSTLVIFDWDDTILDVGDLLVRSQYLAATSIFKDQHKYSFLQDWQLPTIDKFHSLVGNRLKEVVIPELFPHYSLNNHESWADDFVKRFRNYYQNCNESKQLFHGARNALHNLHESGYKLAIATNKSRYLFDAEIEKEGIGPYFSATYCADDADVALQCKPNARMINLIQDKFSQQQRFVMIGDSSYDITAAKNSKRCNVTKTIGILHSGRTFIDVPDITINSVSNINAEIVE